VAIVVAAERLSLESKRAPLKTECLSVDERIRHFLVRVAQHSVKRRA
jgi:hypothetical protein